jgi:hypothetical protein
MTQGKKKKKKTLHQTNITFLSLLQGLSSSTMASRVTPQSYFFLR